jgi:hypothetical protein
MSFSVEQKVLQAGKHACLHVVFCCVGGFPESFGSEVISSEWPEIGGSSWRFEVEGPASMALQIIVRVLLPGYFVSFRSISGLFLTSGFCSMPAITPCRCRRRSAFWVRNNSLGLSVAILPTSCKQIHSKTAWKCVMFVFGRNYVLGAKCFFSSTWLFILFRKSIQWNGRRHPYGLNMGNVDTCPMYLNIQGQSPKSPTP